MLLHQLTGCFRNVVDVELKVSGRLQVQVVGHTVAHSVDLYRGRISPEVLLAAALTNILQPGGDEDIMLDQLQNK